MGCRLSYTVGERSKPQFLILENSNALKVCRHSAPLIYALIYKQEFSMQKNYRDISRHVRKSFAQALKKKKKR